MSKIQITMSEKIGRQVYSFLDCCHYDIVTDKNLIGLVYALKINFNIPCEELKPYDNRHIKIERIEG